MDNKYALIFHDGSGFRDENISKMVNKTWNNNNAKEVINLETGDVLDSWDEEGNEQDCEGMAIKQEYYDKLIKLPTAEELTKKLRDQLLDRDPLARYRFITKRFICH